GRYVPGGSRQTAGCPFSRRCDPRASARSCPGASPRRSHRGLSAVLVTRERAGGRPTTARWEEAPPRPGEPPPAEPDRGPSVVQRAGELAATRIEPAARGGRPPTDFHLVAEAERRRWPQAAHWRAVRPAVASAHQANLP